MYARYGTIVSGVYDVCMHAHVGAPGVGKKSIFICGVSFTLMTYELLNACTCVFMHGIMMV